MTLVTACERYGALENSIENNVQQAEIFGERRPAGATTTSDRQ